MHESEDRQSAIAALWDDARPRLLRRVESLEAAATGPLGEAERSQAYTDAHALVGTLGAFGRADASSAARAAERAASDGDRSGLVAAVRVLRGALR